MRTWLNNRGRTTSELSHSGPIERPAESSTSNRADVSAGTPATTDQSQANVAPQQHRPITGKRRGSSLPLERWATLKGPLQTQPYREVCSFALCTSVLGHGDKPQPSRLNDLEEQSNCDYFDQYCDCDLICNFFKCIKLLMFCIIHLKGHKSFFSTTNTTLEAVTMYPALSFRPGLLR